MRIAIASDIYYPMTNGVAVFAKNLADGLAKQGNEVLVICPSFTGKFHKRTDPETGVVTASLTSKRFPFYPDQINKVPDKKELLGRTVPRFTYKNGIWWASNPWREVRKVLDEFQPDVIHLQTAEPIALGVIRYVKKYNTPLVSTGHAYPDNVTGQFKFLRPVKRPVDAAVRTYRNSFLKNAEYATMPTEMAIGDLVPKNRKRFSVTVEALSNGVDLTEFKPGRPSAKVLEKYGVRPCKQRVIYVGRVDPEKSISDVIKAFELALKKVPEAELLVVGDGTDMVNLKDLVAELGLEEKVQFVGRVLPPDLVDLYRSGAVFATASETETQGIVLIEAAATGLPLIAVDAGAVKEICQNRRNGVLCQPGDVPAIARAMVRILSDEELRKRYGEKSVEIAGRHDLKKTLARFMEIYEEAIKLSDAEVDG